MFIYLLKYLLLLRIKCNILSNCGLFKEIIFMLVLLNIVKILGGIFFWIYCDEVGNKN